MFRGPLTQFDLDSNGQYSVLVSPVDTDTDSRSIDDTLILSIPKCILQSKVPASAQGRARTRWSPNSTHLLFMQNFQQIEITPTVTMLWWVFSGNLFTLFHLSIFLLPSFPFLSFFLFWAILWKQVSYRESPIPNGIDAPIPIPAVSVVSRYQVSSITRCQIAWSVS